MAKRPTMQVGRVKVRALTDRDDQGRRRWRAEWYPEGAGGRMATRSLGRCSRGEAEQRAAELLTQGLAQAESPAPRGAAQVETVRDLLAYWLGYERQRLERGEIARRSLQARQGSVRRLVGTPEEPLPLREVRLAQLTVRRIEAERDRQVRAGAAPTTLSNDLSALRQAIRWGGELGLVDAERLPRVRVERRRQETRYSRRTPTAAEVEATLAHLDGWPRRVVLLQLYCGARPGEVLSATWGDLDHRGMLTLGVHEGARKTGARAVPVPPAVLEDLGPRHPDGVRLVGHVDRAGLDSMRSGLRQAIALACAAAGVERWTPMGLRRLMTRRLMDAGVRPRVYEAQMGHSYQMGVRVYDEATAEDQRAAVEAATRGAAGPSAGDVVPFRQGGEG